MLLFMLPMLVVKKIDDGTMVYELPQAKPGVLDWVTGSSDA